MSAEQLARIVLQETIPHHAVTQEAALAACSAADRLQSGPAYVHGPQHVDNIVPSTPDQGEGARPQLKIRHHVAVSTIIKDKICEVCFSLHSACNLELATEDSD